MRTSQNSDAPPARLLCLSHLRWNFVFQRPQHLMTRAAENYDVMYVEEPIYDSLGSQALRIEQAAENLSIITPILPERLEPKQESWRIRQMLDQKLKSEPARQTIAWYYTPMALSFTSHLSPDLCVYDCMDELSAFQGAPRAITVMESWLFSRADLVFTGGQSLYESKKKWHDNVHAFPSSIDAAHFGKAANYSGPEPEDQKDIPHPRVGYFGVIDERMDLALVDELARLRPQWQFVMIGPVVKIDPQSLPKRSNIHWLGGKPYGELPQYLAGWDAGFMPFAINEATRFISPTKTPEFLAAEVPVVSTPIRDVVRPYGDKGLVEIASTPADTAAAIDVLLKRPKDAWLPAVRKQLATTSWDSQWNKMNNLMTAQLAVRKRRLRASEPVLPAARSVSNV